MPAMPGPNPMMLNGPGPKPPTTSGGPMPGKPVLPGNPAGGPGGPGGSPALAPGAGAGNEAAADASIKAVLPVMHKALSAYPVGSKKYAAVLNALRALTANFGKEDQSAMVPAAIQQMALAAKGGGPLSQPAAPPGLQPAPVPGMGGGPGEEGPGGGGMGMAA